MTQLGCLGALRATRNAREHNLRGWSERPREQRTQRLTDDQQRVVVAQEHSLFSRSGLPRKIQRRRLMSLEHRAVVGKSHTGYSHRCRVRAARSVGHCSRGEIRKREAAVRKNGARWLPGRHRGVRQPSNYRTPGSSAVTRCCDTDLEMLST